MGNKKAKAEAVDPVLEEKFDAPDSQETETTVAIPEELQDYTGYEDFDSADLVIPRIKIIQPTSVTGTPGRFIMNLTEEEMDNLRITVIKATRSRVLWDENLKIEDPICRSNDFLVPDPNIENPQNNPCAEYVMKGDLNILETVCGKAIWIDRERPACNQVFNLLCLTDEDVPFWISLSGVSIGPVKRYISSIALKRKKLWQFETEITTEERSKPKRHYIIKFGPSQILSDERIGSISGLIIALRSQTFSAVPQEKGPEGAGGGEEVPF